jgi:predicted transposase YdaD
LTLHQCILFSVLLPYPLPTVLFSRQSVTYQAILAEGLAEGIAEGIAEGMRRVAVNLLKEGMSVEIVAKVTGLSVEQIQQLAGEEAGNVGE